MRTADFDYYLPQELIAQTAAEPRDASRLLIVGADGSLDHRAFCDIGEFLRPGDAVVLNDTRVLAARLHGHFGKARAGATGGSAAGASDERGGSGAVETLLLREIGRGLWEAMIRPGRRARPGRRIDFGGASCTVQRAAGNGFVELQFDDGIDPTVLGELPLPPYIHARTTDPERYQTVYARVPGSAAAPTAGLHVTPELLARLRRQGVSIHFLTLHVGPGTFRPVAADDPTRHAMHEEWFTISAETAAGLNEARGAGGRIVAVGTTVVRTLEQVASQSEQGELSAASGWTRLLILPGYRFRAVDMLVTNFHLPRSTLLMLVSAFSGRERILAAYAEAVRLRYRFYSFGDAMLLYPAPPI